MTTAAKSNTYELVSVKGTREMTGTLVEAKRAAREMQAELQASWGVDVYLKGTNKPKLYTAA